MQNKTPIIHYSKKYIPTYSYTQIHPSRIYSIHNKFISQKFNKRKPQTPRSKTSASRTRISGGPTTPLRYPAAAQLRRGRAHHARATSVLRCTYTHYKGAPLITRAGAKTARLTLSFVRELLLLLIARGVYIIIAGLGKCSLFPSGCFLCKRSGQYFLRRLCDTTARVFFFFFFLREVIIRSLDIFTLSLNVWRKMLANMCG